ncbi:DBH-like monooxygenase protein 1 [Bulinus truncatus]|nr:DBH-like monooxygenase protein 1 [Bulinus truncatus]
MEDNNYDFDYQQMRLLPGERIIQKGDSLVTECDYDSTGQTEITYGGLASTSEMCQSFLLYFPKLSLSRCISRVYYKIAGQFAQSNILNIVNTLDWTSPAVRANFQQDVNTSPFVDICYFNSTQFFFNLTSMPALSQHFVPDSTCP